MKKMIAILLVLCLLPVTGLAMVFLQKVSDINAFSGNRLNYIETTSSYFITTHKYSCEGVDALALVKAYAEIYPSYEFSIEEYEDNSFKVVLASRKSFMRASIHIRYDAGSDMLKLWYDNEESYYKDTGERYEPAAATPKPSKTRCPNCKGTGSCPNCGGSMWVKEWKYVYVKGSRELTQSTHLCDEKYCYGGSCYMCGGDGWVDD